MSIQPVQSGVPSPPANVKPAPPTNVSASLPATTQGGVFPLGAAQATNGTDPALTRTTTSGQSSAQPTSAANQAEQLAEAIARVERAIQPVVRDISFSVHDQTGDIVVKIIDRESQEVIRQIPSEEMLRLAERIESLGADSNTTPGLLLRQEA